MKTKKSNIIDLKTVDLYNKLYGLTTHHPLVAVVDLKEASQLVNNSTWKYGLYAVFLKNNKACRLRYGMQDYDYQEGTVVTFAPGAEVTVDYTEEELTPDVTGLLFHPDLIYGMPLADRINSYKFFGYSQKESLHLSESERDLFNDCMRRLRNEVEHPVDNHSAELISANIQLLLEYLNRFYDRQFITRHKANCSVVDKFERELKRYYLDGHGNEGIPSVAYFAEKANLTPGYFGDLVKKETGHTAQDLIIEHIIGTAKHRLASTNYDVSIIAYDLGFQYPQHFSRLFKNVTGKTPSQFRKETVA